jgi:poly(3-hydroxybutyrate) depolymerase
MDVAAEYFLEIIDAVFHKGSFAKGAMSIDSNSIDLALIRRTALMRIEAEDDDLAAPGQTRAAHSLCRSIPEEMREELLVPDSGHFSLFHGGKCRSVVAPKISQFFERVSHRPGWNDALIDKRTRSLLEMRNAEI